MPKLLIKRKTISTVTTKYGLKEKHSFLLDGGKGEFWADCFANPMTAEWKEGEEREVELKPREYQGKTYYNIVTPRRDDLVFDALKRIEEKLDKVLGNKPDVAEEVVPPDDIPF